jgi:hypothetical protein
MIKLKENGRALLNIQRHLARSNIELPFEVTRVVDATTPRILDIQRSDVAFAKVQSHGECAAAKCATRMFIRECDAALVSTWVAYLIKSGVATRYGVSPKLKNGIIIFDASNPDDPYMPLGQYRLDVPTYSRSKDYETNRDPRIRLTPRNNPDFVKVSTDNLRSDGQLRVSFSTHYKQPRA